MYVKVRSWTHEALPDLVELAAEEAAGAAPTANVELLARTSLASEALTKLRVYVLFLS